MAMYERIHMIDQMLAGRKIVKFSDLQDRLEVSRATLNRDIAFMRDRLNAPIVFDRELNGYRFEQDSKSPNSQYELPGLWFSAEEIHALLTMQHLLSDLGTGGLLGPHIQPLLSRLTAIIGSNESNVSEVTKRIKIETLGARQVQVAYFQTIGSALLSRKRLLIEYHARGTNEKTEREISPQRLIYYRSNWYLDAWCHKRNGLRHFSLDVITRAEILEKKSSNVSDEKLDKVLGSGYGIFSGEDVHWATLHFSSERARWVAVENWHPNQKGRFLPDGGFELKIPYNNDKELIMDILRNGQDVKVVDPKELQEKIKEEISKMLANY